jgi:excisionase family DNA binding protein
MLSIMAMLCGKNAGPDKYGIYAHNHSIMQELLTTAEVARYLRIKERKIYELIAEQRIPCSKAAGKWLFPKAAIDRWLAEQMLIPDHAAAPPPIVAGSHDPLLEWALRESGCGLALLTEGSGRGLERLAAGHALVAGLHLHDPESGEDNTPAIRALSWPHDLVAIEWARRDQGLLVAPGNPLQLTGLEDLAVKRPRVATRQPGSGAQVLLEGLLREKRLSPTSLRLIEPPFSNESDLALAIAHGDADCGVAIRAAAKLFRLEFLPLRQERFDLALRRRDYFEPPVQSLLAFARSPLFLRKTLELSGYEVSNLGRVTHNG